MSLNITKKRQGGNVQETKVVTFADQTLIRGKDNGNAIPVKVDEQGRLVLAADLNIDVGDISIGAVEQGKRSESAEPWEVIVSGHLPAIWGSDISERPPANEVPVGQQFIIANENLDAWVSNGTDWVAI